MNGLLQLAKKSKALRLVNLNDMISVYMLTTIQLLLHLYLKKGIYTPSEGW
jgi:hypothetical protein